MAGEVDLGGRKASSGTWIEVRTMMLQAALLVRYNLLTPAEFLRGCDTKSKKSKKSGGSDEGGGVVSKRTQLGTN